MKRLFLLAFCFITMHCIGQKSNLYLAQTPPGNTPIMFIPEVVSKKGTIDFGSVFSSDGKTFYYATGPSGRHEIHYSELINDKWTPFKLLLKHPDYGFNDPFLSNDEQRLYFISRKPKDNRNIPANHDIWYVQKEQNGWSDPINAGPQINSDKNEYYISFSTDGSMYFSSNKETVKNNDFDIYRAQSTSDGWGKPVRLGAGVNTDRYEADAFVSPDESYLIFSSREREDGIGSIDLYISFKAENGDWLPAKNMGAAINGRGPDYCPFVTKDGKYLFYTKNNDIYWVSTDIFKQ